MISKNVIVVVLILAVLAAADLVSSPQSTSTSSPTPTNTRGEDAPVSCSGIPIPPLTEEPYYKTGSPERQMIRDETTPGTPLTLVGYVLDTSCQPIPHAWLDFWQTGGEGVYDNVGFNLRGHQYTNEDGRYKLETVIPGSYPGRTPHIHFKVRTNDASPVVTSQLFFPDNIGNSRDAIFDPALVVTMSETGNGEKSATFNIVIETVE